MREKLGEIKGITPEEHRALELALASWKIFEKDSTEQRLKYILEQGGAALENYVIRGQNIEVTWISRSGVSERSIHDKDSLDAVSPGICVSAGTGMKYHLKDMPAIYEMYGKRTLWMGDELP